MRRELILAVDIGGTKLAVGIAERDAFARSGQLAHTRKEPIPESGTPDVVIARAIDLSRELLEETEGGIAAIGISIGGPLDHRTGTVINFPHLPDWKNVPLAARLEGAFGAPARLDNDANLGALAEHRWGAGRGCDDLVYMTVSTGIGGGVIVGGRLLHGVGSGAGEIGHITVQTGGPLCPCGNPGCLERMASGTNIARRARELALADPLAGARLWEIAGGIDAITARHVFEAAAEGDALATAVRDEAAEYIAIGLGSIVHVLAPQVIVLGGGVAQAGEMLLEPVRRRLRDHVFYVPLDEIRVVGAELGHDSALLGAATLALESE